MFKIYFYRTYNTIQNIMALEHGNGLTKYSFWYSVLRAFSNRSTLFLINSTCLLCISLKWYKTEESWYSCALFEASVPPCVTSGAKSVPLPVPFVWFPGASELAVWVPSGAWEPPGTGKFMKGRFCSWQITSWTFKSLSSTIACHLPYPCLRVQKVNSENKR